MGLERRIKLRTTSRKKFGRCILHPSLFPGIMTIFLIWLWSTYVLVYRSPQFGGPPPVKKVDDLVRVVDPVTPVDDSRGRDLPKGFEHVLNRARKKKKECRGILQSDGVTTAGGEFDTSSSVIMFGNETIASLPSFGVIDDFDKWINNSTDKKWHCKVPPNEECKETKFTVIFMAYNPDRLAKTFRQIRKMLDPKEFQGIVEEVVIVWNGSREVEESQAGKEVLKFASESSNPLRIAYPLKMGLPNDLMNRYNPDVVQVKTKAIMYYDDDGPFYSYDATLAGFELWKRHSSAQIGAMARQLDFGDRQLVERKRQFDGPNDRHFVSHCSNVKDKLDYNFRYFANYDANMVLPSGSFLHSNYLCFLWHPVLEPVREFVRAHPVHPDDITVSTIVSQVAGRAPRVYSRRLNPDTTNVERRRLNTLEGDVDDSSLLLESVDTGIIPESEQHRALLFGIDWDAGAGMSDAKQYWADLRTEAINALTQYFGSVNSGSIGWCEGTKYFVPNPNKRKTGKCKSDMAKQGWLPWMTAENKPINFCS